MAARQSTERKQIDKSDESGITRLGDVICRSDFALIEMTCSLERKSSSHAAPLIGRGVFVSSTVPAVQAETFERRLFSAV
jgi:hypothetical protein